MMIVPAGVKVHLALGHTDMRNWTKPLRGSAAWQRRSHPIVLHF